MARRLFTSGRPKNSIRSATGIAVDVITPVGPLSFSLSQPISKQTGDVTEVL